MGFSEASFRRSDRMPARDLSMSRCGWMPAAVPASLADRADPSFGDEELLLLTGLPREDVLFGFACSSDKDSKDA